MYGFSDLIGTGFSIRGQISWKSKPRISVATSCNLIYEQMNLVHYFEEKFQVGKVHKDYEQFDPVLQTLYLGIYLRKDDSRRLKL